MDLIFDAVLPVFGLMLLGFSAAKLKLFNAGGIAGLSRFVFNFALPVMLFRTMANTELPSDPPWGVLLSYYLGGFVCWAVGMGVGRLAGRRFDGMTIVGFCSAFGNVALIGVPLVLAAYGEAVALPLFLILGFHATIYTGAATILFETLGSRGGGIRGIVVNLAVGLCTNPLILGMFFGAVFTLGGLDIPGPIDRIALLLAAAAAPCALFAMGASLTQYRIAGNIAESLVIVAVKLLLLPVVCAVLATQVFHVEPDYVYVVVLLAALPVGLNPYLFAQRYNVGIATSTTAIFLSAPLSVASLSLVLYVLDTLRPARTLLP